MSQILGIRHWQASAAAWLSLGRRSNVRAVASSALYLLKEGHDIESVHAFGSPRITDAAGAEVGQGIAWKPILAIAVIPLSYFPLIRSGRVS
jgi:hypothetical protein